MGLRERVDTSTPKGKAKFTTISAICESERALLIEVSWAAERRLRYAGAWPLPDGEVGAAT